jgi:hypothetical protein
MELHLWDVRTFPGPLEFPMERVAPFAQPLDLARKGIRCAPIPFGAIRRRQAFLMRSAFPSSRERPNSVARARRLPFEPERSRAVNSVASRADSAPPFHPD